MSRVRRPTASLDRFEPDDRQLFFGWARMLDQLGTLVCEHRFARAVRALGQRHVWLPRAGLVPR